MVNRELSEVKDKGKVYTLQSVCSSYSSNLQVNEMGFFEVNFTITISSFLLRVILFYSGKKRDS